MNRIKRILGFRELLEQAWADTRIEAPDTVLMPADHQAADAALDAAILASLSRLHAEHSLAS
jgi:hypothetical protein